MSVHTNEYELEDRRRKVKEQKKIQVDMVRGLAARFAQNLGGGLLGKVKPPTGAPKISILTQNSLLKPAAKIERTKTNYAIKVVKQPKEKTRRQVK